MKNLFTTNWSKIKKSLFVINKVDLRINQLETNNAFSEKWLAFSNEKINEQEKMFNLQKKWFLKLYGFESEAKLKKHLSTCNVILDSGSGLGYKAAWFASLAPHATVLAIDYSDAIFLAYKKYKDIHSNIIFAKGDIANTNLLNECIDFSVCDQVIMHTENPSETLNELARITSSKGKILCYWYKKKALPRELLDEYFREHVGSISSNELWKLSKDVLELGKMLSNLKIEADFPNVPALGIKGGRMDLQRFIYWNFIKCFWNEELGYQISLSTNFDWYSPVNAKRFSREEVESDVNNSNLKIEFFHEEEACYSGRFVKMHNL